MQSSVPLPLTRPRPRRRKRKLVALTTLGLAGFLAGLLTGCSNSNPVNTQAASNPATHSFAAASGNWKFTTGSASRIASFAGALAVTGTSVSGILHPLLADCAHSTDAFSVSGTIDSNAFLSITSSNFSGGSVTLAGTLAEDQHSLANPSVTVTGGPCAIAPKPSLTRVTAAPSAQQYQALTGSYEGSFTDSSGVTLPLTATLSQPTDPDSNGVYHLTGYATFATNPCLNTPVITDSSVTGDSIQATYTDKDTGNTVVGSGTFSPDAQTLTITDWILSGCGDDTGSGLLTRQSK